MFERFTDRARRVVVLAQEEARTLQHDYIGTEHLLLGLIHERDGIGAQVLQDIGVTLPRLRSDIIAIIGRATAGESASHIPFTPRAKKVLELSLREALQLGHNYIGTEHILLGLLHENEGIAAQVLLGYGAQIEDLRNRIGARPGAETDAPDENDPTGAVIASLSRENRLLRREVDRLRQHIATRLGTDQPPTEEPPSASAE
ncbi:Clp protease N-terminal domain-containing protein [Nocardia sp. NPDC004068]|uniref:Clp protease N-terminal domain-containing protein n=1 Tax=Nocardia sp. NPDC004068 TaxID=3364303 RepID=UPI0036C80629